MRLNIDLATTRRCVGWAYNSQKNIPYKKLYVSDGERSVSINLTQRPDVASTFGLTNDLVGFDIVIQDLLDRWCDDYIIHDGATEIYSYRNSMSLAELKLETESLHPRRSVITNQSLAKGRHVLFIAPSGSMLEKAISVVESTSFEKFFPRSISGVNFRALTIEELQAEKSEILANIKNIVVVLPDDAYRKVDSVSPTLVSSARTITLFRGNNLTSPIGTHYFQDNLFILNKTPQPVWKTQILESLSRVWTCFEYYSDAFFEVKGYYFIANNSNMSEKAASFIRGTIQNIRNEGAIRVIDDKNTIYLLNLRNYTSLFDHIGKEDFWKTCLKRGITNATFEI